MPMGNIFLLTKSSWISYLRHDCKYEEEKIFRERLLQIDGWATAKYFWCSLRKRRFARYRQCNL